MEEKRDYKVYKHTSPSGKVYIGITKLEVTRRWKNGHGYQEDSQPLIARAIAKYGWENFSHEVLFTGLTKEEAEQKEIELIAEYDSTNPNYGYNMTAGGNLLSISTTAKSVDQYSLTGEYIRSYESSAEAERCLGHREDNGSIIKAASGIYVTAYNYGWAFSTDWPDKTKFKDYFLPRLQEKIYNLTMANAKTVYQFDENKQLVGIFDAVREAERELGIDHSTISRACRSGRIVHKKYYFSYSPNRI